MDADASITRLVDDGLEHRDAGLDIGGGAFHDVVLYVLHAPVTVKVGADRSFVGVVDLGAGLGAPCVLAMARSSEP